MIWDLDIQQRQINDAFTHCSKGNLTKLKQCEFSECGMSCPILLKYKRRIFILILFNIVVEFVNGFNSLHIACKKAHHNIVDYLIVTSLQQHNISFLLSNTEMEDPKSACMIAALAGNISIVKLFYEQNNELQLALNESVDYAGNSILHYAVWSGNLELVQYLLQSCNMNDSIKNNEGLTAMHIAAAGNYVDILKFMYQRRNLLSFSSSPQEELSVSGMTAFHRAVQSGSYETVDYLLSNNNNNNSNNEDYFDINMTICNGNTALHIACRHGFLSIVQCLIKYNAKVNIQNEYSITPLHYACISGQRNIVEHLIDTFQADLHICLPDGSHCLHLSAQHGKHDICEYILHHSNYLSHNLEPSTCNVLLKDAKGN